MFKVLVTLVSSREITTCQPSRKDARLLFVQTCLSKEDQNKNPIKNSPLTPQSFDLMKVNTSVNLKMFGALQKKKVFLDRLSLSHSKPEGPTVQPLGLVWRVIQMLYFNSLFKIASGPHTHTCTCAHMSERERNSLEWDTFFRQMICR